MRWLTVRPLPTGDDLAVFVVGDVHVSIGKSHLSPSVLDLCTYMYIRMSMISVYDKAHERVSPSGGTHPLFKLPYVYAIVCVMELSLALKNKKNNHRYMYMSVSWHQVRESKHPHSLKVVGPL
jgi:hypothetical protein